MSQFSETIDASVSAIESLRGLESDFHAAAELLVGALQSGRKVLACGNGGSAAIASHFSVDLTKNVPIFEGALIKKKDGIIIVQM